MRFGLIPLWARGGEWSTFDVLNGLVINGD